MRTPSKIPRKISGNYFRKHFMPEGMVGGPLVEGFLSKNVHSVVSRVWTGGMPRDRQVDLDAMSTAEAFTEDDPLLQSAYVQDDQSFGSPSLEPLLRTLLRTLPPSTVGRTRITRTLK